MLEGTCIHLYIRVHLLCSFLYNASPPGMQAYASYPFIDEALLQYEYFACEDYNTKATLRSSNILYFFFLK